jgi:hypothetical protein
VAAVGAAFCLVGDASVSPVAFFSGQDYAAAAAAAAS